LTRGLAVLKLSRTPSGVAFWIHVTPRARRPRVAGSHDGALRVAVAAPPVAGSANAACVEALARALDVKRGALAIDLASRGRRKRVQVSGESAALAARLEELAAAGDSE
jgi:uncharacterized protein YggU (UPF0235/DUF167 family)